MARTPETLTAAQRAADLGLTVQGGDMPAKKSDQYLQQARTALRLSVPTRNGAAVSPPRIDPRSDLDDSFAQLSIDDIEPYAHNPRTGVNPRYDEIKASIKADGITNALTVTRRPGALKFHPYGGGNTRLHIARELFEEGDQRFAKLNVIVKEWRGDANVISAHLAENELRGDITFWEKAQGVTMLQAELQRDGDKLATAAELHKTLKAHGINFGIKTIQNFFFSVEHLAPIGPWLQSRAVNEVIRPAVAGVQAVAERFNLGLRAADSIRHVLTRHSQELTAAERYNEGVDPEERKPVVIDVTSLVDELFQSAAELIGVPTDDIPLMVSALVADARLTADDLRGIRLRAAPSAGAARPASPPGAVTPASSPTPTPTPTPHQRSLAGLLGSVPTSPAPATNPAHAAATSAAQPGSLAGAKTPPQDDAADPLARLRPLLLEISDLVTLHDVLIAAPAMPFGYLVDMPVSLQQVGSQTVPDPKLRAAAWKFLAGLSCQLLRPFYEQFSAQQSTWVAAFGSGPESFIKQYGEVFGARCDEFGHPEMGLVEIQTLFAYPEVARALTLLLNEMERIRVSHPERFEPPTQR